MITCGGSLEARHFVANEDHAGSIPVRRSKIPARSSTAEQSVDNRKTWVRLPPRRPNSLPQSTGPPQRRPIHGGRRQRDEPLGCDPSISGCESRRSPQNFWYNWGDATHASVLAAMAAVEVALENAVRFRDPPLDTQQEPGRAADRLLDLQQEDETLQHLQQTGKETFRGVG